jgi:hypothetical protein
MATKYDFKHKASAEYLFFLFDPEGEGMTFFKTPGERDAYAKVSIQEYCAPYEGWNEDVESICTGVVTNAVKKTDVVKRPPPEEIDEEGIDTQGNWWDADWSEMCNYELVEL